MTESVPLSPDSDHEAAQLNAVPLNEDMSVGAVLAVAMLCVLFGANTVAIKLSLDGFGVFTAGALRFTLAAATLWIWARLRRHSLAVPKPHRHHLWIIGIVFTVQLSLVYLGLNRTNASRGALLLNLQPFFTLFLAHIFIPSDRINARKLIGILLGFSGVACVFLQQEHITATIRSGDSIILLVALTWAANGIYTKRLLSIFSPLQLVLYPMVIAAPCFWVAAFMFDHQLIIQLHCPAVAALVYQIFVSASFGFLAWTHMLWRYGAVSMHSFIFIMPIAGVCLGAVLLGEPIGLNLLVALILIVSGILVIHLRRPKIRPSYPL